VDGFLTAPVPVEGALLLGADIVIAIYLEAGNLEDPRTAADVISRSFNIISATVKSPGVSKRTSIIEPDVTFRVGRLHAHQRARRRREALVRPRCLKSKRSLLRKTRTRSLSRQSTNSTSRRFSG